MARIVRARWGWAAACGIVLVVAVGMAFGAALPVPPDFKFPKGNSPAEVNFSHQKHADAKITNCMDCHAPGKFQMKKGATTERGHTAMNAGKACGTCHNGQRAFGTADATKCTNCHKAG